MEKLMCSVAASACLLALSAGVAFAGKPAPGSVSPTTQQPGSSAGVTCFSGSSTASAPGVAAGTQSAFNSTGTGGSQYAGNSLSPTGTTAASTAAVGQYDI